MKQTVIAAEAVRYLRRFRWALSELATEERDDIAAEVSGHIEDRLAAGASVDDILSGLGGPEDYARSFLNDRKQSVAIATRSLPNLLSALVARAGTNVSALLTIGLIGSLWLASFVLLIVATMKIFDPSHIGLWRSETEFYIGFHDQPEAATEILGLWIFPLTVGLLLGVVYLTRAAALYVLTRSP